VAVSRKIHLHIGRLVLRGIDAADRAAVVSGLKSELARVLADPAMRASLSRSAQTPVLRLGNVAFASGPARARKLGSNVGRAIGRGLKS
jgi:hypothetical protein